MDCSPIAELEPGHRSSKSIKGIVTLIWPFSSSSNQAAFLLADPDFRQRYKKGQVRVQVQGAVARALANSHFGIGDEIILSTRGARWVDIEAGVSTPGKGLDSELLFKDEIVAEIFRNGEKLAHLDVNHPASPGPSLADVLTNEPSAFSTPAIYHYDALAIPTPTSAPAYHKRARKSGGTLVDSPLDPFVSDGNETERPQKKKMRKSWGSTARWKLADRIPSPSKNHGDYDMLQDQEVESVKSPTLERPSDKLPRSPELSDEPRIDIEQRDLMTQRYTQEIIDEVAGDTEEDPVSDGGMEKSAPCSPLRPYRDPDVSTSYPIIPTHPPLSSINGHQQQRSPRLAINLTQMAGPSRLDSLGSVVPDSQVTDQHIYGRNETESSALDAVGATGREHTRHHPDLHIQMPPPLLDLCTDDAYLSSAAPLLSMGPPLITPLEPHTPEIHPIQSANLPLPSPFPGEDLTNPFPSTTSPRLRRNRPSFEVPQPATSPIFPDHLFQFSFGSDLSTERLVDETATIPGALPQSQLGVSLFEGGVISEDQPASKEANVLQDTSQELKGASESFEFESPPISNQITSPLKPQMESGVMSGIASRVMDLLSDRGSDYDHDMREGPGNEDDADDEEVPSGDLHRDMSSEMDSSEYSEDDEDQNLVQMVPDTYPTDTKSRMFKVQSVSEEQSSNDESEVFVRDDYERRNSPTEIVQSTHSNTKPNKSDVESGLDSDIKYAGSQTQTAGRRRQYKSTFQDSYPNSGHDKDDDQEQITDQQHLELHGPIRSTTSYGIDALPRSPSILVEISDSHPDSDYGKGDDQGKTADQKHFELDGSSITPSYGILDGTAASEEALHDEGQSSLSQYVAATNSLYGQHDASLVDNNYPWPSVSFETAREHITVVSETQRSDPRVHQIERGTDSRPPSVPALLSLDSNVSTDRTHGVHSIDENDDTFQPAQMRPEFVPASQLTLTNSFPSTIVPGDDSQASISLAQLPQHPEVIAATHLTTFSRQTTATSLRNMHEVISDKADQEEWGKSSQPGGAGSNNETMEREGFSQLQMPTSNGFDQQRLDHSAQPSDSAASPKAASASLSASQSQSQLSSTLAALINPKKSSTKGLRTPLSYYVPLSTLAQYMNRSSQFDSDIDILAIVYRATSDPVRAERGPRDYFTKFRITQPGFWPNTTLVTVFRAWKEALPRAAAGDAVLLRVVDVIGLRGGGAGLKSNEGSAWCIWKTELVPDKSEQGQKPAWAIKTMTDGVMEEVCGPPVEIGKEERDEAERLRKWWKMEQSDGDVETKNSNE